MSGFGNVDGSFLNEQATWPVRVVAPATGNTVTMKNSDTDLCVNPSGTLATLTIKLPSKPEPGRECDILFTQAITSLTVQDGFGGSITGSPSSASANTSVLMRYVSKALGWKKWR